MLIRKENKIVKKEGKARKYEWTEGADTGELFIQFSDFLKGARVTKARVSPSTIDLTLSNAKLSNVSMNSSYGDSIDDGRSILCREVVLSLHKVPYLVKKQGEEYYNEVINRLKNNKFPKSIYSDEGNSFTIFDDGKEGHPDLAQFWGGLINGSVKSLRTFNDWLYPVLTLRYDDGDWDFLCPWVFVDAGDTLEDYFDLMMSYSEED